MSYKTIAMLKANKKEASKLKKYFVHFEMTSYEYEEVYAKSEAGAKRKILNKWGALGDVYINNIEESR